MFKRRTLFPERPSPPTLEEMLEDLSYAKSDDVVFTFQGTDSKTNSEENEKNFDHRILTDTNFAYLKIKNFVETYNRLEKSLPKLQRQNEQLKMLKNELNEELGLLKQKALTDANVTK